MAECSIFFLPASRIQPLMSVYVVLLQTSYFWWISIKHFFSTLSTIAVFITSTDLMEMVWKRNNCFSAKGIKICLIDSIDLHSYFSSKSAKIETSNWYPILIISFAGFTSLLPGDKKGEVKRKTEKWHSNIQSNKWTDVLFFVFCFFLLIFVFFSIFNLSLFVQLLGPSIMIMALSTYIMKILDPHENWKWKIDDFVR